MSEFHNRRMFLRAAAASGAAWLAADLAQVEATLAWVAQEARGGSPAPFAVLTADEAAAIEALTSRILPSDDGSPGAREAGVVNFVDRSLATFNSRRIKTYRDGVRDLNRRAARRWRGAAGFVALTNTQQDQLIADIEETAFFQALRFDTIVGTFALPTWGGNRNHAGWDIIGLAHLPAFQPPFGYYDGEAAGKR